MTVSLRLGGVTSDAAPLLARRAETALTCGRHGDHGESAKTVTAAVLTDTPRRPAANTADFLCFKHEAGS